VSKLIGDVLIECAESVYLEPFFNTLRSNVVVLCVFVIVIVFLPYFSSFSVCFLLFFWYSFYMFSGAIFFLIGLLRPDLLP